MLMNLSTLNLLNIFCLLPLKKTAPMFLINKSTSKDLEMSEIGALNGSSLLERRQVTKVLW